MNNWKLAVILVACIGVIGIAVNKATTQESRANGVAVLVHATDGKDQTAKAFRAQLETTIKARTKRAVKDLRLTKSAQDKEPRELKKLDWEQIPTGCSHALVVHVYHDEQQVDGLNGAETVNFLNASFALGTISGGEVNILTASRLGQSLPKNASKSQVSDAIKNLVTGIVNDRQLSGP